MNYAKKRKSKVVITTIALIAILLGAVAGVLVLTRGPKVDEGYVKVDSKFYVGSLDKDGEYVSSENSIYTKSAFACEESVKVVVDFDSNVQYQVFFYDDYDKFVSSSEITRKGAEFNVPTGATRARVLITPIWDSTVEAADRVVKWNSINKYAKQLTISVKEVVVEENVNPA